MADIFISYARDDRERVAALAAALESQGFSLWWDDRITGGDEFPAEIERELKAARATVVVWSAASANSRWVRDEAALAADAGKLVPIRFDDTEPPLGFKQLQAIDFGAWPDKGGALVPTLAAALRKKMGEPKGEPLTPPTAPAAKRGRTPFIIAAAGAAAVLLAGGVFVMRGAPQPAATAAPLDVKAASIAVLPFADLSEAGDQVFFADGVSEEILNALSRTPDLKVAGRTSSFSFRDADADLREIGRILGVAHILEGSVRRQGDRVRVTAQLVKAEDGFQLWSENFDRNLDDIFAVQDAIAAEILDELAERLDLNAPKTRASIVTDPDVYAMYLEAKQLIHTRGLDAMERAETLLDQAIAQDANYAPAYAERALARILLSDAPGSYGDRSRVDMFPLVEADLTRALTATDLADAHAVHGLFMLDESKLDAAVGAFRRALNLNPSHLNARNWLAFTFSANGRIRDRAELLDETFWLDPLFHPVAINAASELIDIGAYERAERILGRLREIEPDGRTTLVVAATIANAKGEAARATQLLERAYAQQQDSGVGDRLSWSYFGLGEYDVAARIGAPRVEIFTLYNAHRFDDARELAKRLLDENPDYYLTRRDYLVTLVRPGWYEDLIAYYDAIWGDLIAFEKDLAPLVLQAAPPFWALAEAYRETGRKAEFDAVMRRWRMNIDFARAGGAENFEWYKQEGDWHAYNGEIDLALDFWEKALEPVDGLFSADSDDDQLWPLLEQFVGNPRYQAMKQRNRERVNEERAKLGLAPYPFPAGSG